jgi:hypothetical protein
VFKVSSDLQPSLGIIALTLIRQLDDYKSTSRIVLKRPRMYGDPIPSQLFDITLPPHERHAM